MPSSHRRIGLVLDESLGSALAVLREHADPEAAEAALAREAVFGGVVLDAVLRAAAYEPESRVVEELRRLLETVELPQPVRASTLEKLDRAAHRVGLQERRRRQLALLETPNPYGPEALALKETFDDLELWPE